MALLEDVFKGNLVATMAVGATALVLPKVLPNLSPPLRFVVKDALSLFLESQSEAEDGIIGRLANTALQNVLKGLSAPGSGEQQQQSAQAVIEKFKHTARIRARRYGRDEADRSTRYNRHVAALRAAIDQVRSSETGTNAAALHDLSAGLAEV